MGSNSFVFTWEDESRNQWRSVVMDEYIQIFDHPNPIHSYTMKSCIYKKCFESFKLKMYLNLISNYETKLVNLLSLQFIKQVNNFRSLESY